MKYKLFSRNSLRTKLLIFMVGLVSFVIVSFFFAWKHSQATNAYAVVYLQNVSVKFIDGFEDPIGPNSLYFTGQDIPRDGSFESWFSSQFCRQGFFQALLVELSLARSDLEQFSNLVHLQEITIDSCKLPSRYLQQIAQCEELQAITISNSAFQIPDVSSLACLGSLRSLILVEAVGDLDRSALTKQLGSLNRLDCLVLDESTVTTEGLNQLRHQLSQCEIIFRE